jgi:hypothetical protein
MQNRYVEDIGDYVKLAILRALSSRPSVRRLGVAWWLFPDEPMDFQSLAPPQKRA